MNGFDPSSESESVAATLAAQLLEQSEQEFGHSRQEASHPNPLLTQWLCKKHLGAKHFSKDETKAALHDHLQGDAFKFEKGHATAQLGNSNSSMNFCC